MRAKPRSALSTKRPALLLLALICCASPARAAGTSGAILLTQPVGARALGLSEAYSASDGDVLGVHYNPACSFGWQASMLYQRGVVGDSYGVLAFGCPSVVGRFAGSLVYYDVRDIELIDSSGRSATVNAQRDFLGAFFYSYDLGMFALGGGMKLLHTRLVERVSSFAVAVDAGAMCRLGERVRLGLALQNAGMGQFFLSPDGKDKLPLTVRGGAAGELYRNEALSLRGALDVLKVNDLALKENLGFELVVRELLALRAGYRLGYDSAGLSLGLGVSQKGLSLDYALSMMGELGPTHYAGLDYRFKLGRPAGQAKAQAEEYSFLAARLAYGRGEYREALRILKIKDEKKVKDADYYVLWGNTLSRLDMEKEALEYYRWALKLDPANAELRGHVEKLERQLEQRSR